MTDKQRKELYEQALDDFEIILDTYAAPDFLEVVGRNGGDTITYRYYANGLVLRLLKRRIGA